jgi:hypothetical protein
MLESYISTRNCILENLEDISKLASLRSNGTSLKAIQELKEKLVEGKFNLAVLGQFKR